MQESVANGAKKDFECAKDRGNLHHQKVQSTMEASKTATDQMAKSTLKLKSPTKLGDATVTFQQDPGLKSLCDKAAGDEENDISLKTIHLVVLGHVDAGKSTLMGRMLFETGVVGEREVMKAKKEAQAIGKGSFAWAWMLDERPEERNRGVTVDVAMARYLIFFVFALCFLPSETLSIYCGLLQF